MKNNFMRQPIYGTMREMFEIIRKGIIYRIASAKEFFNRIIEAIDKEPPRDWMADREDYLTTGRMPKDTRKK